MGLKEQQDLLARLYTDSVIQRRFTRETETVSVEFGLTAHEAYDISAIASEEMKFFSDSLFWKRFREVQKLLPLTTRTIGPALQNRFREFSTGSKPISVKKHLEDTLGFAEQLLRDQALSPVVKDVVKFERTRLKQNAGDRRISVCRLGYDIRPMLTQTSVDDVNILRKRAGIAVWLRAGKTTRFFFI